MHRDGTHILSLYNKQANQQCISNKKAEAIANKAQKEALKAERALQAKARRQTCSGWEALEAEREGPKTSSKTGTKRAASQHLSLFKSLNFRYKAKKQVEANKIGDGEKGTGRSVKSVVVRTTCTRTVRMPQRSNKTP